MPAVYQCAGAVLLNAQLITLCRDLSNPSLFTGGIYFSQYKFPVCFACRGRSTVYRGCLFFHKLRIRPLAGHVAGMKAGGELERGWIRQFRGGSVWTW